MRRVFSGRYLLQKRKPDTRFQLTGRGIMSKEKQTFEQFLYAYDQTEIYNHNSVEEQHRYAHLYKKDRSELKPEDLEFMKEFEEKTPETLLELSQRTHYEARRIFPNSEKKQIVIYRHSRFFYYPEHDHDYIEIIYVVNGELRQKLNGKDMILQKGDVCILDLNSRHTVYPAEEDNVTINLLLRPEYFEHKFFTKLGDNDVISSFFLQALHEKKDTQRYLLLHTDKNDSHMYNLLRWIWEEQQVDRPFTDAIQSNILNIFLIELVRSCVNMDDLPQINKQHTMINKVLDYISENCSTCSITDLADHFGYSSTYMGDFIKRNTGQSFSDIRLKIRLNEAKTLLKSTNMSIVEIAESIGYSNISHFYRLFRKDCSMTPIQYRAAFSLLDNSAEEITG